jgi:hypothetical protein
MKKLLIIAVLLTACSNESPEIGRVVAPLQHGQWDGDAGAPEINVDPQDAAVTEIGEEDEAIKFWREATGCQVTPAEFFAFEEDDTVAVFESEFDGDGYSSKIFRACGRLHDPYLTANDCFMCCGWWIQCFPLAGCEWFYSCWGTECVAFDGWPSP